MKLIVVASLFLLQLASSSSKSEDKGITKQVVVGDEFPAISVGIWSNQTTYSTKLDTTNHSCDDGHTCAIYIYLSEMFCKKDNPAHLLIQGTTLTNKTINVQWCRDNSLNGDPIKDVFVQVRHAIIKPIGDWSHVNATISILALFTVEKPLVTKIVSQKEASIEFDVTESVSQYNSYFNGTCPDNYAGCGITVRIELTCKNTGKSTDLQLTAVLLNNETISKNLCPPKRLQNDENVITVYKYLTNVQQLLLTPLGDWKSSKIDAHIDVNTFYDFGTFETCSDAHFNCKDNCELTMEMGDKYENIDDNSESNINCVPWDWICDNGSKYCVDFCDYAQQYCPEIKSSDNNNIMTTVPPLNETTVKNDDWVTKLERCIFYYSFFAIALILILLIFFGTAYILRTRKLRNAQAENNANNSPMFSLFGKFRRRDVPYQIVQENER